MIGEYMVIVDKPFDPESTEQPFGSRWGGDVFVLTPDHLAALQTGQAVALDVMNEYISFLVLEQPNRGLAAGART